MKIEEITKQYRDEHGLSQRQFSIMCGLSPTYIWYLEQGKHPQTGKPITPSLPALMKIAKTMGLTVDELMSKCDNMLVAISDEDDRTSVFLSLFAQLTPEQKDTVLTVMRSYIV